VLPPYTAVIEWLLLFKFETEKVACPDVFKVLEPSVLLPSFGVNTLLVAGLTAAVLMHHSRTASGKVGAESHVTSIVHGDSHFPELNCCASSL